MTHEFSQHKLAYGFLILGLIIFMVSFFAVWPNRWLQRIVIVMGIIFYTSWGSLTHFKSDHLTRSVIYEYFGIAFLGGGLLFLVTI
jgi:hypothetical protein